MTDGAHTSGFSWELACLRAQTAANEAGKAYGLVGDRSPRSTVDQGRILHDLHAMLRDLAAACAGADKRERERQHANSLPPGSDSTRGQGLADGSRV